MIEVEVEDYCQNCEDFNPDCTPVKLCGGGVPLVVNTVIKCQNRSRCRQMYEYLRMEIDK